MRRSGSAHPLTLLRTWRRDPMRPRNLLAEVLLLPLLSPLRTFWRGTRVIGITGSLGKTTTKELIRSVLMRKGPTLASRSTRNRAAEVARLIAARRSRHQHLIAELGAWGPATLDQLVRVLKPDIGVVTVVASDHFKQFRGPDNVAREKVKLAEALPPTGVAILNCDDSRVRLMADRCRARVVLFGTSRDCAVRAVESTASWPDRLVVVVAAGGSVCEVQTQLLGRLWVPAVLAAVAVGRECGLSLEECAAAIAATPPVERRMSPVRVGRGITYVRDDFKNSTGSIAGALEFLHEARAERKVLVVGVVSDQNKTARRFYPQLARRAREVVDLVVLVGRWSRHARRARIDQSDSSIQGFEEVRAAHEFLASWTRPGDLVLIKGSSSDDHLERLTLARLGETSCWRLSCGRTIACSHCNLRLVPEQYSDRARSSVA